MRLFDCLPSRWRAFFISKAGAKVRTIFQTTKFFRNFFSKKMKVFFNRLIIRGDFFDFFLNCCICLFRIVSKAQTVLGTTVIGAGLITV